MTSQEVNKAYLSAFGPELGPLYYALENEVVWLHAKWLEYRKLFAKSQKRIDLLNEASGFFFRVVQDVLWDDVLLHIARLTDPAKQGRFENLTVARLDLAFQNSSVGSELSKVVEVVKERAQFAREWRNRRIAHRDLSLALDLKARPLPGASRQHVEDVLASIREAMNLLRRHFLDSDMGFEHFLVHDDADLLVHHLSLALRTEAQRRARLLAGDRRPEDFECLPEV